MRVFCLLGSFLVSLALCLGQTANSSQGSSFPSPPAQNEAWTPPPTKLSPATVSAVIHLFADGMADPRHCEYREIEVVTGQKPRSGADVKTHGWIIPTKGSAKFAVCWNGAVYPLIGVGAPVDLDHDVSLMLKNDQDGVAKIQAHWDAVEADRKKQAEQSGQTYTHVNWGSRWDLLRQEDQIIAWDQLHPIKAVLLLRLGKASLAEEAWHQWYAAFSGKEPDDPYLPLVDDWAYSLFMRAAWAHFNGEDNLSLASATALLPLKDAGKASAASKKLVAGYSGMPQPYLRFLDQIPSLIADEQRRVDEPATTPVMQMNPLPKGSDLMAGLVHDLELVNELPDSSPGAVDPMNSPIVQALVKQGDAAVEPLLNCYQNDTRLTRSLEIDFGKPSRAIGFIDVREMAYVALINILHNSNFGNPSKTNLSEDEGRRDLTDRIRAYWQQIRGKTRAQIAYDTLSDDAATTTQWAQAADYIVRPSNIVVASRWTVTSFLKPGETPPLSGESLRSKTNPSVSDLLLKRMNDQLKPLEGPNSTTDPGQIADVYRYAVRLAQWDGKAHLDAIRAATVDLNERFQMGKGGHSVPDVLIDLYEYRIKLGDAEAANEYASIAKSWVNDTQFTDGLKALQVIAHHPDDPALAAAAEALFCDPKSAWVDSSNPRFSSLIPNEALDSPLVGVPAFRTLLLRILKNEAPLNKVTVGSVGTEPGFIDPLTGRVNNTKDDSNSAPTGTTVGYRVCDQYAHELSYIAGAPSCELDWSLEKREAAVKACREFLEEYGNNFKFQLSPYTRDALDFANGARIHFPRLDHPATAEDVKNKRAIFSLDGKTRIVLLPWLPLDGSWSKQNGSHEIRAWQAEEVWTHDHWQRFYGVTGRWTIAKVPAEEIKFSTVSWQCTGGLESHIVGPSDPNPTFSLVPTPPMLKVGMPVNLALDFRNAEGVDQTVPGALFAPTNDGKTLPSGISIQVFYSGQAAPDDKSWTEVPMIPTAAEPTTEPADRNLMPGEEVTTSTLDLRNFFNFDRPGSYRIHITPKMKIPTPRPIDDVVFCLAGN